MQIIKDITEDEMVAVFLKGEIDSFRFGEKIVKQLDLDTRDRNIVDNPNTVDASQNEYRRILLGKVRGFGNNAHLFENFPKDIQWKKAILEKKELQKLKYINYDYWVELSGGTRLVTDGANNVLSGLEVFSQSNKRFFEAAESLKAGKSFSEIILVASNEDSSLVILEGHLRMTAYMMDPQYIPDQMEVIIGFSKNINQWGLY